MKLRKSVKIIFRTLLLGILLIACIIFWGQLSIQNLPASKPKDSLRIITMNVAAGNVLSQETQDRLIRSESDILVVIEWNGDNLDLRKFNSVGYSVILNHPGKAVHGLCILSKLGGEGLLINSPIITPCALPIGQFRFKIKDTPFCLFALHAPPPVTACAGTTDDYLDTIVSWIADGKLNQDIGIGKSGDRVLIAGDLNTLPFQNSLVQFRKAGLLDHYSPYNFVAPTWKPYKRSPYLAKIDYILVPKGIPCENQLRFEIAGSDHLGLMGDIVTIGIE
ncbi:MAG TPA: hypothetical protein DIW47_09655 [Bacteroidetes bacterium]|nr:hypothetical protein [Bacteroidota bacterium]